MNGIATTRAVLRHTFRPLGGAHNVPLRLPHAAPQRCLHLRPTPPPLLRRHSPNASRIAIQLRHESTASGTRPLTDRSESERESESDSSTTDGQNAEEIAARKAQEPAYEMTFTCRKCLERSSHRITKQAYHFGTTLITCPGCKNRHLISDHLKIFSDKGITVEDILREKGQYLKKGRLGADGDVEFYNDEDIPEQIKNPRS